VPEGIIFKNDGAYKQLRKMLVEDGLWAVVSLPQGVFNPYSGVQTNILFFNNTIARQTKEILFVKVENDGFDLGAQRKPISENDLPTRLDLLKKYKKAVQENKKFSFNKEEEKFASIVKKEKIANDGDYNLSANRYKETTNFTNQKWPIIELGEVLDYEQPTKYIVSSVNYNDKYTTPVLTAGKTFILGYTNEKEGVFKEKLPVIIFDDFTTATKLVDFPFKVKSSAMKILHAKEDKADIKFLYYVMQKIKFVSGEHKRYWISEYSKTKISLPPLEVQQQIVDEINGYQKIIEGAKQIVENYRPSIKIDPKWEMAILGDICDIKSGGTPKTDNKSYWEGGNIPWVGSTVCKDSFVNEAKQFITESGLKNSSAKKFKPKTTLIALVGATIGKTGFLTFETTTNQNIAGLYPLDLGKLMPEYLFYISQSLYSEFIKLGSGKFRMANLGFVKKLKIPFPTLDLQKQIVVKIEEEQKCVNSAKEIIKIFEQKIKDKISEV
jgi:type I restriction enzyme M protein